MSMDNATTARDWLARIASGSASAEQLLDACLQQVDASESTIGAWACLDRETARQRAGRMDELRRLGRSVGDLHGIPVGLKDNIDTADLPTAIGSSIHAGRQPDDDAALVQRLRGAGAVILGKTVSTELAWIQPAATRNPHDHAHSPGGSSSGSAAAVAAGHVPLAVGSQTGGSVIRPASYCGVYGFKPSRGIISRRGLFETSPTLDQVGVFGLDAGDVAWLADVLAGYDAADGHSQPEPRPRMLDGYRAEVPVPPKLAWIDMPYAERYADDLVAGSDELVEALGGQVERIEAPRSFAALLQCHKVIYEFEIYRCLGGLYQRHRKQLGPLTRAGLEQAALRSEAEYREALDVRGAAITWFEQFFHDYDAIVTPSALGEAPLFEDGTGDPVCCVIWTLCGLPCISLPLLQGAHGLPIGVQLVGAAQADDRLLRTCRWLLGQLGD